MSNMGKKLRAAIEGVAYAMIRRPGHQGDWLKMAHINKARSWGSLRYRMRNAEFRLADNGVSWEEAVKKRCLPEDIKPKRKASE